MDCWNKGLRPLEYTSLTSIFRIWSNATWSDRNIPGVSVEVSLQSIAPGWLFAIHRGELWSDSTRLLHLRPNWTYSIVIFMKICETTRNCTVLETELPSSCYKRNESIHKSECGYITLGLRKVGNRLNPTWVEGVLLCIFFVQTYVSLGYTTCLLYNLFNSGWMSDSLPLKVLSLSEISVIPRFIGQWRNIRHFAFFFSHTCLQVILFARKWSKRRYSA